MSGYTHKNWFSALKYLTYGLLMINVSLFLQEELLAAEFTIKGAFSAAEFMRAFSATVDTTAWVILLLLFELETYVLPDEKIRGATKWGMHGVRGFCYLFIVYAFFGYLQEMFTVYNLVPLQLDDACSLVDAGWSMVLTSKEYAPLDPVNCATLGGTLWQLNGLDIVADADAAQLIQWLAWADVLNSAAWILVVVVLEIDVRLQLAGLFEGRWLWLSKIAKFVLYSILFLAAVYWGIDGDFLDFWDAFLWLFAFIFIEMNIFDWAAETSEAESA